MSEGNGTKPEDGAGDSTILVQNSEQCCVELHQRIKHTLECMGPDKDYDLASLLVNNQLVLMRSHLSLHGQSPAVQEKAIQAPKIVAPDFMRRHRGRG